MSKASFGAAVTAFILAATIAGWAHTEQTLRILNALTVPAAALSGGCVLAQPTPTPSPTSRGGVTVIPRAPWFPFPTNPWSGHDRRIVTAVRKAIDGTPRLPDGPPLDARAAAAFELKLADHVVEAYHAAYAPATGPQIEVFAATFDDITLAKPESLAATMNPPRGFRSRVVKGATVVLVSSPAASECVRSIDAYVRSLTLSSTR